MPFAPRIRKTILQALDCHILPSLEKENDKVTQVLAGPPFDFSSVPHWTQRKSYLSHKKMDAMKTECQWKKDQLVNCRMPSLAFFYEGVADDRIGITTHMAKEMAQAGLTIPGGITVLRLEAPAVICYYPGVPHSSGIVPYCDKGQPGFASSRLLWIHISTDELLVHYCESEVDSIFSSHLLSVKDCKLTELADLYMEELQYISTDGAMITRGLLLALMKRLRRHFASAPVPLSNSAWPDIPQATQKEGHLMSEQLYQRATRYIGLHLQDNLTWEMLSEQFGVSPFYLNRVFRQFAGMPVMRYVNSQRIEAAKQMLFFKLERVNDIARLTGFASLGSFSNSFKKHVGCAPSEFRRRMDRKS